MRKQRFLTLALAVLVAASIGAFSARATAETKAGANPVRIGFVSILSGRLAMLGQAAVNAMAITAEDINKRGGLLGRPIEIIHRDSKGQPEEAVKLARDFIERDKVDFLIDGSTTREAFAIKEVTRDLKFLTFVSASETTEFTADPAKFGEWSFRTSRQSIHDMVAFAMAAAEVAKKDKLTQWYAIIPDYAFGRDQYDVFFSHLKQYYPEVNVLGAVYPKLFEPDYTPHITTVLAAKPQAVFSVVWGGDAVALYKQAKVYGLFDQMRFFQNEMSHFVNTGEMKEVPEGYLTTVRHSRNFPDTPENQDFWDRYVKQYGIGPVHWSYEASAALLFLEGAVKKAGSLEHAKVKEALKGIAVKSPWGQPPEGTITLRANDQTCINYAQAVGYSTSKPPYFKDITPVAWSKLLEAEAAYLKQKGWTK